MFGLKFTYVDNSKAVLDAKDKAAFRNFGHASASISKDMKASVEKADGPSPAGSPPHTHKRAKLRFAIAYQYDKEGAVIGPRYSIVGDSGKAHEFGGEYKGEHYPKREFAGPSLERNESRFAGEWTGSIGQ